MTEPDHSLAGSEQWAREFAADYPRGHMDVLLAEYDQRGERIGELEGRAAKIAEFHVKYVDHNGGNYGGCNECGLGA